MAHNAKGQTCFMYKDYTESPPKLLMLSLYRLYWYKASAGIRTPAVGCNICSTPTQGIFEHELRYPQGKLIMNSSARRLATLAGIPCISISVGSTFSLRQ